MSDEAAPPPRPKPPPHMGQYAWASQEGMRADEEQSRVCTQAQVRVMMNICAGVLTLWNVECIGWCSVMPRSPSCSSTKPLPRSLTEGADGRDTKSF